MMALIMHIEVFFDFVGICYKYGRLQLRLIVNTVIMNYFLTWLENLNKMCLFPSYIVNFESF